MSEINNNKLIPLTQGKFALVDDEDFERLSKFKWSASKKRDGGYMAVRHSPRPNRHTILMHRQIMNCPQGMDVDHIDHNQLDNRKAKLRICTHTQNLQNSLSHKGSKSRFKGVCWHKGSHKWQALIRTDSHRIHLGYFASEIEAAKTYDAVAIKYFREFASLNFPK